MHFEDFATPEQCCEHEDPGCPWTEAQKKALMQFCKDYQIDHHGSARTPYWLGPNSEIFDHTNVWFDKDHRRVISSCPYDHIREDNVLSYADEVDRQFRLWRDIMARNPRLKRWDGLRQIDNMSMRDHVHFHPQGYHHEGTVLIVIDAEGIEMLRVLKQLTNRGSAYVK